MGVQQGSSAPEFAVESSSGKKVSLKDLQGKWVILYFYPKDDTPGCTREACSFRDNFRRIDALDAIVLGVSPDDLKAHDKFIAKHELPFTLLADTDRQLARTYGVWKEKNMYGKKVMGIERTTFLIDPDGHIHRIWPKVKVDNHVDDIIDELKAVRA